MAGLGELAEAALKEVVAGKSSPEAKRAAESLLEGLGPQQLPGGELLWGLRAVELLEHTGSAESREMLRALAGGTPEARLTHEAQAALGRLDRPR